MLREGAAGVGAGLSAENYARISGASPATARDLADILEKGELVRRGERRRARYQVAIVAG